MVIKGSFSANVKTNIGGKSQRERLGMPRRVPTRRFIPDGDSDFAQMARHFAEQIKLDPERFALSADIAEQIDAAVQAFRDALAKSYNRITRSMHLTALKDEARAKAEKIVRKYGTLIRLNDQISAADKTRIRVHERRKPVRREKKGILMSPHLRYIGTIGEATLQGHKHVLDFCDFSDGPRRRRPPEASRIELFVELVEPEEKVPDHPGQLSGGRMWYVRSYSTSPIHVDFPTAKQPMRVVYWARWADAKGNVGPFCRTVVARVEGWDGGGRALPNLMEGRERPAEDRHHVGDEGTAGLCG